MYKPEINTISEKIVMKKSPEKKGNIWDNLYKQDKNRSEKRDQLYIEKKIKEEKDSLKGCTFQPMISMQNPKITERSPKKNDEFYKRSKEWKNALDQR